MLKQLRVYFTKKDSEESNENFIEFEIDELEEAEQYKKENNIETKIEIWEYDGEWEFVDFIN